MAENIIKGDAGLLSRWDADASAYLPVACLTSFSHTQTQGETTRQTFCNPGVIEKGPGVVDPGTVDFEGLFLDTTSAPPSGDDTKESWDALHDIQDTGAVSDWRLEVDLADTIFYFSGWLNSLTLTFGGGDTDASFSGSITLQDLMSKTDPNAPTT